MVTKSKIKLLIFSFFLVILIKLWIKKSAISGMPSRIIQSTTELTNGLLPMIYGSGEKKPIYMYPAANRKAITNIPLNTDIPFFFSRFIVPPIYFK